MHCLLLSPTPTKSFFPPLEKKKCSNQRDAQQIHAQMIKTGFIHHTPSLTKLLSLFLSLSAPPESTGLAYACMVFDHTHHPNTVIWNTVIRGFVNHNLPKMALLAYVEMLQESNMFPDRFTFPSLLKACAAAQSSAFTVGMTLHGQVVRYGLDTDLYIRTTLITMYAACGDLNSARAVFGENSGERNHVVWSSMISGYARNRRPKDALNLFDEMLERSGQEPDKVTVSSVLSACAELRDLDHGKKLHSLIRRSGMRICVVLGTSLVDMYAKCGELDLAKEVFDMLPETNVVAWSAMISGYAQNNKCEEAVRLFKKMATEADHKPNEITIMAVLSACGQIGDLAMGRWVHAYYIGRAELEYSSSLQNSLVDMYSKCGEIDVACEIFDGITDKDVVSWNVMINGLALHGLGEDALVQFSLMQEAGFRPDDITFIGVLSACSRAGLVEEGCRHYQNMSKKYRIIPKLEHYGCMVDLLSRAGMLEEAENFIREMPMEPNGAAWGALLGGCRVYDNVELSEKAAKHLLNIEPYNDGVYVILSNIFARRKRWEEARAVRALMRERGIRKTPGCSSIVVDGVVHEFMTGDLPHPESEEIFDVERCVLLIERGSL